MSLTTPDVTLNCVLETTPGVYQASGYGDLTATESIWCVVHQVIQVDKFIARHRFWFFAARKNSDTAPLALWFNGGVRLLFDIRLHSYILNSILDA